MNLFKVVARWSFILYAIALFVLMFVSHDGRSLSRKILIIYPDRKIGS